MGLLPLEYTDCLSDTPHYRENLRAHEKELETTSQAIKGLIKEVKDLLVAAKTLSKAQRSLASTLMNFQLDCIGSSQTDDEIIIAGSLKEFGRLVCVIEDERDRMLDRAEETLIIPIENFRKENIGAAKEGKKKFDKGTAKFCQSLERHLNLSLKKGESHLQEADATLEMEQRHFFQASLEYASLLMKIQEKKKFEFVETILSFMAGLMTFYHQGYEVANEFKPFMTDLQRRLQRTRDNFNATDKEAEQLKRKTLEKAQDPGTLNKMYTRQGYLFLQEKKALGSTWSKHFCQYQKYQKKFSLMPYSQTIGKIMNGETITVKECIGRQYDSIDKRFCFDIFAEDKPVPYTFQALSDEDKRLWLDAMDGKEPIQYTPGKNPKQDVYALDESGFSFVQWCINFIESKGLQDQGLYRLVGVNSKVLKLTQLALENKGNNLISVDDEECELKTVTSALKNFFRNLPEPLLTFRLHGAFIAAAKQENRILRINNIHSLVHSLPKPNFKMLELLTSHLCKIAKLSHKNLMTISNLGICFGPTLLRPEEETVAAIMEIKFGNVVVEILIENYDKIFKTLPDGDLVRRQPPPYIPPPPPNRKETSPLPPSLRNRSSLMDTKNVSFNMTNYAPNQSSYSPSDQKQRTGMMLYNPIWNNGLPLNDSIESVVSRTIEPSLPIEQKNYPYYPGWNNESGLPRTIGTNSSDIGSQEIFAPNDTLSTSVKVRTLYACRGENEMELSFEPNEVIYNVSPSQEPGWIRGTLKGKTGLVPENYVEYIT
ncbi:rho GTPase-activating protein 26 [Parasteatoda tepidariorum]|uniref:rho GTPase-activating protein 26 n=1 Tax=Parasteatoda tepidariorum TaxID=114398 RepID=UPI00077F9878|nr:rho GTPase-activating protein 26 [Parasteatoda tepidariorum]